MFLFHHKDKDKDKDKEEKPDAPRSPTIDPSTVSLHKLAKQGDLKTIQKAVKAIKKSGDVGAYLSSKNERGMTPLHFAAESGSLETVEYLIAKGAKVNVIDKEGWSPLHIAAQEKHFAICKVAHFGGIQGCSPNIQNAEGTTAFHYIARAKVSPECKDCFAAFQAKGGDINAVNKYGETSLHQAVARLNTEMAVLLLELGAAVDAKNKFGETALHKCARVGEAALPIAKILIEKGANPLISGSNGLPSYVVGDGANHTAAKESEIHKYLLEVEEKKKQELVASGLQLTSVLSQEGPSSPLKAHTSYSVDLAAIASGIRDDSPPVIIGGSSADEIKAEKNPIVEFDPRFRIEIGNKSALPSECEPRIQLPTYPFQQLFYKHKHINLIGTLKEGAEKGEKVVISVLEEATGEGYTALILRSSGYEKTHIAVSAMEEMKKETEKAKLPFAEKCALHFADHYDLAVLFDSHVPKQLVALEKSDPALTFCVNIGVLLAKKGQKAEREMFDNEHPTDDFSYFMRLMGDKITLSGWSGYRGGLDVQNNSHGRNSYYADWHGLEVMYHVAQLMPYNPSDVDKLIRSGVLRNDVGIIVFQEFGSAYTPASIRSKLNHVIIVVSPCTENGGEDNEPRYKVAVVSRPDVAPFMYALKPQLPFPPIFPASQLKDFLLTKMVHGIRAAHCTPAFDKAFKEPRRANIDAFAEKFKGEKKHSRSSSSGSHSHSILGALLPKRTGSQIDKHKTPTSP